MNLFRFMILSRFINISRFVNLLRFVNIWNSWIFRDSRIFEIHESFQQRFRFIEWLQIQIQTKPAVGKQHDDKFKGQRGTVTKVMPSRPGDERCTTDMQCCTFCILVNSNNINSNNRHKIFHQCSTLHLLVWCTKLKCVCVCEREREIKNNSVTAGAAF